MIEFNVLIVDDLRANLLTIRSLIEQENISMFEASSGEEALKVILLNKIDLILLDVQMPGMSGFEVAEILRENSKTSSIPIIFITAIDRSEELSFKGYQLGAVDFLYKPINKILLQGKVKVFMNLSNINKTLQDKNIKLESANKKLKKAESKILALANTDHLTGIPNRRALFKDIKKSWRNCLRSKCEISFIMIDIDNFKIYNDSFGHIMGDKTLIAIANEIQSNLYRPYDEVGRYGGEEFLVILPNTNHIDSLEIAEKIRSGIFDMKIEHSSKFEFKYVSISLGVSTAIPEVDLDYEAVINEADQRLLISKSSGKNKVTGYR